MTDPFLITGPAVISVSGGRTSLYMLHRILLAHGGSLPDDVVACFDNTGREMPATLDFVRDCEREWRVPIVWLEYCQLGGKPSFAIVGYESAARNGEPFKAMLDAKPMLPNPVARFCTIELKLRTTKRYLMSLGWKHWTSVVGLRADEPRRVVKALDRERTKKDRWHNACPLAAAGVDEMEVLEFWRRQSFNLRLRGPWEGNCDGCFLKNKSSMAAMCETHPDRMKWWADMEATPRGPGAGGAFRKDRAGYAAMLQEVADQGRLRVTLLEPELSCDEAACGA